jgi:hypothetical protein
MPNPGSRDFERNERQEAVRNPGNTTDNAINLLSDPQHPPVDHSLKLALWHAL